jgi:hypothetical protein
METRGYCEGIGTWKNDRAAKGDGMNGEIIDAEQAQKDARAASDEVNMIYDKDITGSNGSTIGVSAFDGGATDRHPVMINIRYSSGVTTHHLSLDEAMGLRDALTAAIASLTGAP